MNLDFMPSPVEEQPGLLIRDPFRYSEAVLVIPPPLVEVLRCFDGEQTELDLRQELVRISGQIDVGDIQDQMMISLSRAGFLDDENFAEMRDAKIRAFAEAPIRAPSHAGSAYPIQANDLKLTLANYMHGSSPGSTQLRAIAAPHVSPFGGWESYRAGFGALAPGLKDRTFVILGTSHYGEPDRFGLTRKRFATPFGEARTNIALVDELEKNGGAAVKMEDYCHAVEHSIEFQVIFLQYLFGPDVNILPILCGSYAHSIYHGGKPEDNDQVRRFLGELGSLASRENDKLFWVLGIDMAHMGSRYGDEFVALADREEMAEVAARDRQRIDQINAGSADGFWDLVQQNQDDLKWCGSAPLYTFMKTLPDARGNLLHYQQWNIDEESVVSFAGMSFT